MADPAGSSLMNQELAGFALVEAACAFIDALDRQDPNWRDDFAKDCDEASLALLALDKARQEVLPRAH